MANSLLEEVASIPAIEDESPSLPTGNDLFKEVASIPPAESPDLPSEPFPSTTTPSRSLPADVGVSAARGVLGAGSMLTRAGAGLSRFQRNLPAPARWALPMYELGRTLNQEGTLKGEEAMRNAANSIDTFTQKHFPESQETRDSEARSAVTQGIESGLQSFLVTAPALLAGPAAPIVAGGIVGGAFGGNQYEQSYQNAKDKGLPDDQANAYAWRDAAWEAGPEFLGEAATWATLGIGKIIGKPLIKAGKEAFSKPIGEFLRESAPRLAKEALGAVAMENAEEVTTAAGQSYNAGQYGMLPENQTALQQFTDQVGQILGPTTVATLLQGGSVKALDIASKRRIARALENPLAPTDARREAAFNVFMDLHKDNPDKAVAWMKSVKPLIDNGEPVDLSKSVDEQISTSEAVPSTTPPPPATVASPVATPQAGAPPRNFSEKYTVPESEDTTRLQAEAALDPKSTSAVVFIPKSYTDAGRKFEQPKGMEEYGPVSQDETGEDGTVYFNPEKIGPYDIQDAIANGKFHELLGHVAPKPAENAPVKTAVARVEGTEAKASVVTPETADAQVKALQEQFPKADVTLEQPEKVIGERQQKEPWQMTRDEFHAQSLEKLKKLREGRPLFVGWGDDTEGGFRTKAYISHHEKVAKAISEGKPVPAEVLADYPDLQKLSQSDALRGEAQEPPRTTRKQDLSGEHGTAHPTEEPLSTEPPKGIKQPEVTAQPQAAPGASETDAGTARAKALSAQGAGEGMKRSIATLDKAVAAKDAEGLKKLLHTGNKNLRAIFSEEQGVKLPKTASGTKAAVDAWVESKKEVKYSGPRFRRGDLVEMTSHGLKPEKVNVDTVYENGEVATFRDAQGRIYRASGQSFRVLEQAAEPTRKPTQNQTQSTIPTPEIEVVKATAKEIKAGAWPFRAIAQSNDGGRLAIDAGGETEQEAREKVKLAWESAWRKRIEERQSNPRPTSEQSSKYAREFWEWVKFRGHKNATPTTMRVWLDQNHPEAAGWTSDVWNAISGSEVGDILNRVDSEPKPQKKYTQLDDLNDHWWTDLFRARMAANTVGVDRDIAKPIWNDLEKLADAVEAKIQQNQRQGSKPKPEVKSPAANITDAEQARLKELQDRLRKKLGQTNVGPDPEILSIGAEMAGIYIKGGVRTFKQFAAKMKSDMGDVWDKLKGSLLGIWQQAANENPDIDDLNRAQANAIIAELDKPAEHSTSEANPIRELILSNDGPGVKSSKIRKMAEQEGVTTKVMQERIEAELVKIADEIASERDSEGREKSPRDVFDKLIELYNKQPRLTARTSTSVKDQAYSTPIPLSYVSGRMIDIRSGNAVYEPTAGNGSLLIGVDKSRVTANEKNPDRASALRALGVKTVTEDDATIYLPKGRYDREVMNPPFGGLQTVNYDGYKINRLEHIIALKALEAMTNDGAATMILGANREAGSIGAGADTIFFNYLYGHYNVVGNFEVSGDLYANQGAKWPVRVVVVAGRKSVPEIGKLAPKSVDRLNTWDEVWSRAEDIRNETAKWRESIPSGGRPTVPSGVEGGPTPAGKPGTIPTRPSKPAIATGSTGRPQGATGSGKPVGGPVTGGVSNPSSVEGVQRPNIPTRPDVQPGGVGESTAPVETGSSAVGGAQTGSDLASDAPAGTGKPEPRIVRKPPPGVVGTEHQIPYIPRSDGEPFGTLIPNNIGPGVHSSLDALVERVGSLDKYLADKLNLTVEEIHKGLAAEQIDGASLAIDQIESGGALIIGDETGIGKGRQAAAVIRYAIINGKIPIFFTQDPKLFTDMHGDLQDIGTSIRPLIFGDPSKASIVDQNGNVIHKAPGKAGQERAMANILEKGMKESGYDSIFVTYSQINDRNNRQKFLEQLASNNDAVVLLDEAHNAAGDSESSMQAAFITGGQVRRGSGANQQRIAVPGLLTRTGTKHGRGGVVYLSATYAKRPDNMPVYFRTDIRKAAQSFGQIVEAMKTGGVALQQAVSEALAKVGQYVRRERDFSGVPYDMKRVQVADQTKLVTDVDEVTSVLHAIKDFSRTIRAVMEDEGGDVRSTAQTETQTSMTDFASIVHNQIGQLLLAAKADSVVEEAIAAHKRGEKPVIALMNTMEHFLDDYVDEKNILPGQPFTLRWNELLEYALSRTLRVTEKDAQGNSTIRYINPDEIGLGHLYREVQDMAKGIEVSFPVSPIDYILQRLEAAGVRMGELTGRVSGIKYSNFDTGEGVYHTFKKVNKNTLVNGFNGGTMDGMLLNASGSTGLSAHAAPKFKDQRRRHMIIAQAALDINVFVQTLGRIKRTGMIPGGARYTHMVLPLQAELRPAAMAARKMKSLNANTTAEADSAVKIESVDLINKYGDQTVAEYLDSNPELQRKLDLEVHIGDDGKIEFDKDLARKFTGRMALLSDSEQKRAYDAIIPAYHEYIDQLKTTGEYDLDIVVHDDWDARPISDEVLRPGENDANFFTSSVHLQQWEVKDTRHVPTGREMQQELATHLRSKEAVGKTIDDFTASVEQRIRKTREEAEAEIAKYPDEKTVEHRNAQLTLTKLTSVEERWRNMTLPILNDIANNAGEVIELVNTETGEVFKGTMVDMHLPKQSVDHIRVSPSAFRFKFSVQAPGGTFYVKGNDLMHGNRFRMESSPGTTFEDLRPVAANARYIRHFVTGNPIAAYDATGQKGNMVRFKTQDGETITGLMMAQNWSPKQLANDPRVELVNGKAVSHFLRESTVGWNTGTSTPVESDVARILKRRDGYTLVVPSARRTGGDVYLDERLLRVTGDFNKVGNRMTVPIPEDKIARVADIVMDITKRRFKAITTGGDSTDVVTRVQAANAAGQGRNRGPSDQPLSPKTKASNHTLREGVSLAEAQDFEQALDEEGRAWFKKQGDTLNFVESADVRQWVEDQMPAAKAALKAAVTPSDKRAAQQRIESLQRADEYQAFYDKESKQVFVNLENIQRKNEESAQQAVAKAVLHELAWHKGIHGLIRTDAAIREKFARLSELIPDHDKDKLVKRYPWFANWREDEASLFGISDEWAAERAEKQANRPLVRKLIETITDWIMKRFPKLFSQRVQAQSLARELLRASMGERKGKARENIVDAQKATENTPFVARNAIIIPPGYVAQNVEAKIKAHHGTPHKVDKFSTSKIGTGEGAQVYGWGLYFADLEEVGKQYADALSYHALGEKPLTQTDAATLAQIGREWPDDLPRHLKDTWEAKAEDGKLFWDDILNDVGGYIGSDKAKAWVKTIADTWTFDTPPSLGNTYTVTLDVEPDELLDWDKPLSEQSEKVKKALQKAGIPTSSKQIFRIETTKGGRDLVITGQGYEYGRFSSKNRAAAEARLKELEQSHADTGATVYREIKTRSESGIGPLPGQQERFDAGKLALPKPNDALASDYLNSIGIPGIKYADQGSRNRQGWTIMLQDVGDGAWYPYDGSWETEAEANRVASRLTTEETKAVVRSPVKTTYNYVMFDDSRIHITHENGQEISAQEAFGSGEVMGMAGKKQDQTETPAFKKWFGNSKVVDEQGKPLVVYHGGNKIKDGKFRVPVFVTESKDGADWFAGEKGGKEGVITPVFVKMENPLDIDTREGAKELFRIAREAGADIRITGDIDSKTTAWSFHSPTIAKYSYYEGGNEADLLYIPAVREALLRNGYDGLVLSDPLENTFIKTWVAIQPTQIKSATGNSGTFDPTDTDIRAMAKSPTLSADEQAYAERINKQPARKERRSIREILSDAYTKMINATEPIEALSPQIRKLVQRYRGVEAISKSPLFWKTSRFDEATGKTVVTGKSLKEIIGHLSDATLDDMRLYMAAKRDVELAGRDILGIDPEQAGRVLKAMQKRLGPGGYAEIEQLAEEVRDWTDRAMLKPLLEVGAISQEQYDGIKQANEWYTPFNRVMDTMENEGLIPTATGRFQPKSVPLKKIKGSERDIIDPFESLVSRAQQTQNFVERARVAREIDKLAQSDPNYALLFPEVQPKIQPIASIEAELTITQDAATGQWDVKDSSGALISTHPTKAQAEQSKADEAKVIWRKSQFQPKDTFLAFRDGKRIYRSAPGDILKALNEMSYEETRLFVKILRWPASVLRAGATLSLEFLSRNPVRDQWTAMVFSKYGYIPGIDLAKGMASILGKDDYYHRFLAAGGEHSQLVAMDRVRSQAELRNVLGKKIGKDYAQMLNPVRALQTLSAFMEQGTRVGAFRNAMKKGASDLDAMAEAREITLDFSRVGSEAKMLNQIVAFLNANVQDIDKLRRTLGPNAWRQSPKAATAATVKAVLGITIPSVALWALGHYGGDDDDKKEYANIPQWQKDAFWVFKAGGKWWRVPKPFSLGLIFGTSVERMLDYSKTHDPEIAKEFASRFFDTFTPNILPTAFQPAWEATANYSTFRNRPIVSKSLQDLPAELQYTGDTGELARILGKQFRLSPKKIEHMIRGYTGGLGQTVTDAVDEAIKDVSGKQLPPEPTKGVADLPGVRGWAVREPIGSGSEAVEKFYRIYTKASEAKKGVDALAKQRGDARAYLQEHPEYYLWPAVNDVAQKFTELRKARAAVYASKTLSGDEKKARLQRIDRAMTDVAERVVGRLGDRLKDLESRSNMR